MKFRRPKLSLLFSFMFKTPVIEQNFLQRSEAFLSDMKAQANPWDLYRWAHHEIMLAKGQRREVSYLPGFVGWTASRMPRKGIVEPNDGTPYVHLIWKRGGDRWGMKVGAPDFAPTAGPNDHYLQWAPGVYVWHEIKKRDRDRGIGESA